MSINKIKKIIPLKNKDKANHEKWYHGRNLMDFPAPISMLIIGAKGCGKSTMIKNLLSHASPYYDSGFLCHYDAYGTSEYDDAGLNILEPGYIPHNEEFDNDEKKIIIFEDLPYESLTKEDKIKLNGILKYSTTHKLLSVIWTTHDFSSVPPSVRRLFNVFVVYKIPDMQSIRQIGIKAGLNNDDFNYLFNEFVKDRHDSICIDLTNGSPAPIRLNMFHKISVDN